jgi:hypothetical protein
MFARLFVATCLVLSIACLASCGSVSTRPADGGGTGGVSGGGVGGSSAADGGGTGGAPASDAGSLGGATGTGGVSGSGGSGAGGSGSVDAGIFVRGAVGPFGPIPASTGTIRLAHPRMGPTLVCSGNICASGGLIPQ